MTPQQQLDADVAEWQSLKDWLTTAKERETFLRQSIAERVFPKLPTGAFPEGTVNKKFAGEVASYQGKLVVQWKREILAELLNPTLEEAQLTPDEAVDLIRNKPELGVKAYKALPPEKRAIVDKMVATKQGSIALEVTRLAK